MRGFTLFSKMALQQPNMPKLAANLSFMFKDRDFLDRFSAAAACGFRGVEFGAEVPGKWTKEQLVAAKESAGVEVVSLCTPLGDVAGDKGLAAVPKREADFKVALGTAIEYAKALQCPRVHALAGVLPGTSSSHPIWKQAELIYISNLKYAAEECAKCNITLLIEPISTIQDYFLQHQQHAIDIIRKVEHPNVKLEFDVFHAQTMDGNICAFFLKNAEHIGHVQIAQVPERNEPDENGELNYPFLFKKLGLIDYKGWIGCEYHPRGKTEDGLGWAADYLKKDPS